MSETLHNVAYSHLLLLLFTIIPWNSSSPGLNLLSRSLTFHISRTLSHDLSACKDKDKDRHVDVKNVQRCLFGDGSSGRVVLKVVCC